MRHLSWPFLCPVMIKIPRDYSEVMNDLRLGFYSLRYKARQAVILLCVCIVELSYLEELGYW